jgi:hypothetical protein
MLQLPFFLGNSCSPHFIDVDYYSTTNSLVPFFFSKLYDIPLFSTFVLLHLHSFRFLAFLFREFPLSFSSYISYLLLTLLFSRLFSCFLFVYNSLLLTPILKLISLTSFTSLPLVFLPLFFSILSFLPPFSFFVLINFSLDISYFQLTLFLFYFA